MLQCPSPLLAQSGHRDGAEQCPLLGVKRTTEINRNGRERISSSLSQVKFFPIESPAQICRADADLHDARFVDAGDADIFEDLVVGLALARLLNHDLLRAGDQRPERRSLRLLGRIRAEREIGPGSGQIGMARGIGDQELLDGGLAVNVLENSIDGIALIPFFSAAATYCAVSVAPPTM